ncbi:nucleoredoxin-like protein 2 [Anoplophora glabripennis]|uniref:nucleoredoxin-like protein 2 n=1 Tax=Anoplophora glabripennis TaxID=217634 RepID=UPI0008747772|nr:nucleoredoxin-like protein 2 [Anoplophora glabripennis]
MDMLQGKKLVTKDCQSHKATHYLKKAKIIIYYFSASWVDDVDLLQKLKAIYAENVKREIGMEVIYVSSDTEEKPFNKPFREHHGPWPAIAPKNIALAEELRHRYNITCLPQIIVVRKEDGFIITRKGREELQKTGMNVLVVWSDYDPDMTLIDDNLIDLTTPQQQEVATETAKPDEATEPKQQKEEYDEYDFTQIQSKVFSFGPGRKKGPRKT